MNDVYTNSGHEVVIEERSSEHLRVVSHSTH